MVFRLPRVLSVGFELCALVVLSDLLLLLHGMCVVLGETGFGFRRANSMTLLSELASQKSEYSLFFTGLFTFSLLV